MVKKKTIIKKPKSRILSGKIKLRDVEQLLKKFRKRGLKPFIKGKGSGKIKIEFE